MKFKHPLHKQIPYQELLLILLFVILVNNYFKNEKLRILADGKGYYDYLPALVIYHDLNFQFIDTLVTELYNHREASRGYLPEVNGKRINKYFIGTAIAQAPFFLAAHIIAKADDRLQADGYAPIYQDFVFYAALFYTFVGLFFLRKIMALSGVQNIYVLVIQATVLFAGSLMYYINSLPSFSHAYSFGHFSLFLYLVIVYFKDQQKRFLFGAALCLGLIILIRPVNVLVVAFVPFLFDSFTDFKQKLSKSVNTQWKALLFAILLTGIVVGIQMLIWHLQTGQFIVYSYQNEGFILSKPNVIKFLFSYQKGLFVYAPAFFVLFIAGLIANIYQRNHWKIITFIFPFFLTAWILSSWWVWYYGGSFGSRVMIEYYGLMAVFGSSFFRIKNNLLKILLSLIISVFIYVAIIQTYQYKNLVLSSATMSNQTYWKVFLKTDQKYQGILYHKSYQFTSDQVVYSNETKAIDSINPGSNGLISIENSILEAVSTQKNNYILQIRYDVRYEEGTDQFVIRIKDSIGNYLFSSSKNLIYGTIREPFDGIGIINLEIDHVQLNKASLQLMLKKNEPAATLRRVETKLIVNKQTNRP